MGSPISVVVTNLMMEDIEQRTLSNFQPLHFWKRYMDDTCIVLLVNKVTEFHLNSIETSIQFTVELGKEKVPFLDVLLIQNTDGPINTSVYRKSTHNEKYLSFFSHHPTTQKASVVCTLFHRARTIPSTG